jgi:hypothetical protein
MLETCPLHPEIVSYRGLLTYGSPVGQKRKRKDLGKTRIERESARPTKDQNQNKNIPSKKNDTSVPNDPPKTTQIKTKNIVPKNKKFGTSVPDSDTPRVRIPFQDCYPPTTQSHGYSLLGFPPHAFPQWFNDP